MEKLTASLNSPEALPNLRWPGNNENSNPVWTTHAKQWELKPCLESSLNKTPDNSDVLSLLWTLSPTKWGADKTELGNNDWDMLSSIVWKINQFTKWCVWSDDVFLLSSPKKVENFLIIYPVETATLKGICQFWTPNHRWIPLRRCYPLNLLIMEKNTVW